MQEEELKKINMESLFIIKQWNYEIFKPRFCRMKDKSYVRGRKASL